jgi:Chaperone of endosialidase
MEKSRQIVWLAAFVALVLAVMPAPVSAAGVVAQAQMDPLQVRWEPQVEFESLVLTVSTPSGTVVRQEFKSGETPVFDLAREGAVDGSYTWELRVTPHLDAGVRSQIAAARQQGDTTSRLAISEPLVQSGSFRVANGAVVRPDAVEESGSPRVQTSRQVTGVSAPDQVIADDLIVQGSACVGFDCVNNESFGFDTLRLKENNTRIKFEDTSVGSFPTHDWQLTANDSASGGQEKFSIEDITAGRVPFTVEGSSTTNSIYIDSTGRIGFRTSTPVLDLHVNTSNTPGIRLEQNSSGGFSAQSWDIAGNETNFFIRDATNGSRLPFRIRPGAPSSSIDIAASGNVGIGTASPSSNLHVVSSGTGTSDGKVLVQNTNTSTGHELLELRSEGGQATMVFKNSLESERWANGTSNTSFVINNQANTGVELTITNTGNVVALGTISGSSDRNMKKDISAVRPEEVLSRLASLPIATWSYKTENVRHMGPMAQDFSAAFGLGADDTHIAYGDMAGVTMAAVQSLNEVVQKKETEITDLKSRIETLEKLVRSLVQEKATTEPPI